MYAEKKECWQTLNAFLELHSPNNIIIVGDLNIVLNIEEKRGGSSFRDQMLHVVEDLVLQWDFTNLDFKPKKGLYTCWKGGSSPQKFFLSLPRIISL